MGGSDGGGGRGGEGGVEGRRFRWRRLVVVTFFDVVVDIVVVVVGVGVGAGGVDCLHASPTVD